MTPHAPVLAAVATAVALLLLPGCAGGPARPPVAPVADAELSVSLVQNRSDPPVGRLQLRVTNGSDDELRIDRATLRSTALAEPAVWRKGTTIPPGATRDLPVRFPSASCTAGPPETVVRIEGSTPDQRLTVDVTPADPNERMNLLTGADCFAREIAAVGTVSLGELRVGDLAEPARLQLRVESAGGSGLLRIRARKSTTLFTVLDATGTSSTSAEAALELRPGDADAAAWISIVPNRCDPHALAEDKIGTVFVLAAEVDGGRSGSLTLPAPPELRRDLYDYFTRACGL